MPRYFFDIHNGAFHPDDEGTECADFEAARKQAMASLPEVARWEIPSDGDRQAFTVLVRDEDGVLVYTATLTFAGLRLAGPAAV
ncbi:DUF6894 family protein [Methylobacterium sp. A49B]